ncbi:hypothetical protein AGR5A_Cc100073 [Agrobacterium genomosp. 5 str. CFBP 6626]|nr:hypothetical protein AGR5A_Cc100073 [Agrobacterium genomosp. 5 str. CFBP 6626]
MDRACETPVTLAQVHAAAHGAILKLTPPKRDARDHSPARPRFINVDCCNKLLISSLRRIRAGLGPALFHAPR